MWFGPQLSRGLYFYSTITSLLYLDIDNVNNIESIIRGCLGFRLLNNALMKLIFLLLLL